MFVILLFVVFGIVYYYLEMFVHPETPKKPVMIKSAILAFILSLLYYFSGRAYFHFEVTPWKKECLKSGGPNCCPSGFSGMNVGFNYTNDQQRLMCGDNIPPPPLSDNVEEYHGYSSFDQGYGVACSYNCSQCKECTSKPVEEEFCGSCSGMV